MKTGGVTTSDVQTATQTCKEHKKTGSLTPPEDHSNLPVTKPDSTKMFDLPDEALK